MKTVLGYDAQGEPIFALRGGVELKNANGDIPGTSLGYQRTIDTLTYMKKLITTPKYYEINIAEYLPVVIGEGSFADNILTNITINGSGDFEEGFINQGIDNSMLAKVNAGISSKTVPVVTWAKSVDYTQIELEQALFANSWNIINARHTSRQMNYELGLQQLAFLGSRTRPADVCGLLTQPNVNINTALITASLSSMSVTDYTSFIGGLYEAYRQNCNRTARPNRFVLPESDFNGLQVPYSPSFPNVSKMDWLMKAFAALGLSDMKVLPCVYGMPEFNADYGLDLNRYALYNAEEESLRMDIPVNIRSTMPGTLNNFQFQDAAFAMFTGAWAYRELEMLYFDY